MFFGVGQNGGQTRQVILGQLKIFIQTVGDQFQRSVFDIPHCFGHRHFVFKYLYQSAALLTVELVNAGKDAGTGHR